MRRSFAATLTLVLALFPSALAAQQTSLTVSGFAGVFIPATDLFDELGAEAALRFGHESGAAFGGRVAVWPSRKLGIEAEAGYLASNVEFRGVIIGVEPIDTTIAANAFVASINVLYAIIRPPLEPLAIFISGGVGVVSRGGEFFDTALNREFEKTTSVAGVVGLGISYGLSQMLSIRADVKDYISSFDPEVTGGTFGDTQLQNDILITGSLELTFGGG